MISFSPMMMTRQNESSYDSGHVTNGDFSTGDLTDWTTSASNGGDTPVYDNGTCLVYVDGTASNQYSRCAQINLVPSGDLGKVHILSCDVTNIVGTVVITLYNKMALTHNISANGHFSVEVTPDDVVDDLYFGVNNSINTERGANFDNISLRIK